MSTYMGYLSLLLMAFGASTAFKWFKGGSAESKAQTAGENEQFRAFQKKFLFVYLIMMCADWMQGPYVYKLYSYYGFDRHDNGILFIAGFGSSLVFGTWAGPLADKYGRKLNCILYGVTYTLSCMTKHFPHFGVLMVGRLLGGFATSILWSAFESWMVSEHTRLGFDPALISDTFSLMITYNGLVAIGSGFLAQWAVDLVGHPVAPFDLSAIFLVIGSLVVFFTWTENYGETRHDMIQQVKESIASIKSDTKIVFVGLQQSLFEGAMYTFVFMWTPTLEDGTEPIPHGLIFAAFMIACSLGATLFGFATQNMTTARMMRYVFLTASATMATPMLTTSHALIMGSFVLFEVMVGMFWPGIGTLRSRYVPDHQRATIINLFRMPLNAIVCAVLYFQGNMTIPMVFTICTVFHLGAFIACLALEARLTDADEQQAGASHTH